MLFSPALKFGYPSSIAEWRTKTGYIQQVSRPTWKWSIYTMPANTHRSKDQKPTAASTVEWDKLDRNIQISIDWHFACLLASLLPSSMFDYFRSDSFFTSQKVLGFLVSQDFSLSKGDHFGGGPFQLYSVLLNRNKIFCEDERSFFVKKLNYSSTNLCFRLLYEMKYHSSIQQYIFVQKVNLLN